MNFFKELLKAIEISLIGGKFKFHIDFTTTSNLLDLFNNAEEEKKREEEAKKKAEEEAKKKEEEEEYEDDDWD